MWASFNYCAIQMTLAQARSVSGSGQQIDNVRELLKAPNIARQFKRTGCWAPTPDTLRKELDEYGSWDDAALADDEANRERIVWIAGCNIAEEACMKGRK